MTKLINTIFIAGDIRSRNTLPDVALLYSVFTIGLCVTDRPSGRQVCSTNSRKQQAENYYTMSCCTLALLALEMLGSEHRVRVNVNTIKCLVRIL